MACIVCIVLVCLVLVCFFFFFKQKTAYEMRISDWSSDVCSSDLSSPTAEGGACRPPPSLEAVPMLSSRYSGLLLVAPALTVIGALFEIGRASCRERVCQYV